MKEITARKLKAVLNQSVIEAIDDKSMLEAQAGHPWYETWQREIIKAIVPGIEELEKREFSLSAEMDDLSFQLARMRKRLRDNNLHDSPVQSIVAEIEQNP